MLTVASYASETLTPFGSSSRRVHHVTRLGSRNRNELNDYTKTAQGFAAPVDADQEKAGVRFYPLACCGGVGRSSSMTPIRARQCGGTLAAMRCPFEQNYLGRPPWGLYFSSSVIWATLVGRCGDGCRRPE
jgi:hypothetical protein